MKIRFKIILPVLGILVLSFLTLFIIVKKNIEEELRNTITIAVQQKLEWYSSLIQMEENIEEGSEAYYTDYIRDSMYKTDDIYFNGEKASDAYQNIFTNAYPFVLDNETAQFIYYLDRSLENIPLDIDDVETGEDIIKRFIENKTGVRISYFFTLDNEGSYKKIAITKYIPTFDYTLVFSYYEKDFNKIVFEVALHTLYPFIITFIIMGIVLVFISLRISGSVVKTKDMLKNISEGEGDLTARLNINTKDELEDLSSYFNKFITQIQGLIKDISQTSQYITTAKENVVASTEENTSAIEQISSNTKVISERVNSLQNSVTLIQNSLVSIGGDIDSMDSDILSQVAQVEESSSVTTEIVASIKNLGIVVDNKTQAIQGLSNTVEKGKGYIEGLEELFKDLSTNMHKVTEMVGIISNIASESGILSMNASIESAHAGDAGKGFSVVAQEMRKLADNSSESASVIGEVIKLSNQSVSKMNENVVNADLAFKEIYTEISSTIKAFSEINYSIQEIGVGSNQITESVEHLNEATSNIKDKSSNIKLSINSIKLEGEKVEEGAKIVNDRVSENSIGVDEMFTSMQTLQETSGNLSKIVKGLEARINKFKI